MISFRPSFQAYALPKVRTVNTYFGSSAKAPDTKLSIQEAINLLGKTESSVFKVVDYTLNSLGHSARIDGTFDDETFKLSGFGPGYTKRLLKGDYILLPAKNEKEERVAVLFRVEELQYERDPADAWGAKVTFIDETSKEEAEPLINQQMGR